MFTIHTPVSAGNERFDTDLVRRLAAPLAADSDLDLERILELGRGADDDPSQFDMTAFSLRLTNGANAVSQLHARDGQRDLVGHPRAADPGHHQRRPPAVVAGRRGRSLYGQLGARPRRHRPADQPVLGAHRRRCPTRSCGTRIGARSWSWPTSRGAGCSQQFARHGEAPSLLEGLAEALDPDVLTIGFARRFATYKRASLLFSDEERLARLLLDEERPVQIVFAGKAHPADRPGQRVIQDIFTRSRSPKFAKRVFVLEDYDIRVGRYLVQGVDVWLNNPRRPLEASGTSGMKAAMNGVINCSVLDGWWDEGYNGKNGWAIGGRETSPRRGRPGLGRRPGSVPAAGERDRPG